MTKMPLAQLLETYHVAIFRLVAEEKTLWERATAARQTLKFVEVQDVEWPDSGSSEWFHQLWNELLRSEEPAKTSAMAMRIIEGYVELKALIFLQPKLE